PIRPARHGPSRDQAEVDNHVVHQEAEKLPRGSIPSRRDPGVPTGAPQEIAMSDKKNPPMPSRSEEEVVFGDELPVLPIRNAVLFPGAVAPFDVGREKSVALVEDVDNL